MRTTARIVEPTTAAAANRVQPSFWKYVSVAIAIARIAAAIRYSSGSGPAPA